MINVSASKKNVMVENVIQVVYGSPFFMARRKRPFAFVSFLGCEKKTEKANETGAVLGT